MIYVAEYQTLQFTQLLCYYFFYKRKRRQKKVSVYIHSPTYNMVTEF